MATQKDFRIKNGLIVQNGNTTVDQGTVSISDQISGDTGQLTITNGQSGSSFMRIGIIGSGTANSHIRTDSTLEFHIGQSATSATPSVSIDTSGNATFTGTISNSSFTIPNSIGSAGQVLKVPSTGTTLEWGADSGLISGITNFADNRILTASGSTTINGEADLTWNDVQLAFDSGGGSSGSLGAGGVVGSLSSDVILTSTNRLVLGQGGYGRIYISGSDIDISGNLKIGNVQVINSSRNMSNIGTISSGAITTSGDIDLTGTSDTGDEKIILPRSGYISFYGDGNLKHAISSMGTDDIRINSYGEIILNLDSNNNQTDTANFKIVKHGGTSSAGTSVFTIDGENGNATFTGTISSGAITSTGNISGVLGTFAAPNAVTGSVLITGGNTSVSANGEVNSELNFGSNDASATGGIGGSIKSITEYSNGAQVGMGFYTAKQGRSPVLEEAVRISNDGNLNLKTGHLQINGTTVIDSSRKILNLNGGMTLQQDGTYGGGYGMLSFSGTTNGHNRILGANNANDGLYLCSATGEDITFRTNGGNANTFRMTSGGNFQMNNTTVIDSSRNLTNIGTISSGSITSSDTVSANIVNAVGYRVQDTRNTATSTNFSDRIARFDFKANNNGDGLSDGGTFHGQMLFQQWQDATGGDTHALGFTDNGNIWHRRADIGGTWGSWYKLVETGKSMDVSLGTISSGAITSTGVSSLGSGTTVGSVEMDNISIGNQEAGLTFQPNSAYRCIHPKSMTATAHTSDISLGWSNNKWKDIYLAGFVKADSGYQIGTTTVIDSSRNLTNISDATINGEVGIGVAPATTWKARIQSQYPLQILSNTGTATYELYAQESGIKEFRIFNSAKVVGQGQNLKLDTSSSSYQIELATNGSTKLATTSGGASITGELDTTGNIAINKDVAKLTINNNVSNGQASIDIKNTGLYARYILDGDDLFRIYNQTSGFDTFAVKSDGDLYMGSTKWFDLSRNLTNIGTISSGLIDSRRSGANIPTSGNSNLYLVDTRSLAADTGGSIVFSSYYQGTSAVSGGSYIKGYKENANSGDFGYGLKFGVRENGQGSTGPVFTLNSSGNATFTGTISSGAITSTGNSTFSGVIGVGGTSTNSSYGVYLQNNKWYATQYSSSHDVVRMNANTGGGLDVYNQTDSAFANVNVGSLSISGTGVINSSRNLINIGTITSGAITSTGKLTLNDPSVGGWIQSNTSVRIDIDTDNNQTDRAFIVSKNNSASDLLTIFESGVATFAGTISNDAIRASDLGSNSHNLSISGTSSPWSTTNRATIHLDGVSSSLIGFRHGNANKGYIFATGSVMEFLSYGSIALLANASGSVYGKLSASGIWNVSGSYALGGTTVIDSSRNLTNIGTISSGAITSSDISNFQRDIRSAGQIRATGWYNATATTDYTGMALEIGVSGTQPHILAYNRDTSSYGNLVISSAGVLINPRGNDVTIQGVVNLTSSGHLKIGSTTVIDSSRNLTNIGTINSGNISSGNIVSTGDITANGYLQAYSFLYTRNNLRVLNAGGTGWKDWAVRSNGNYNLDVGTIDSGAITSTGILTINEELSGDASQLVISNTQGATFRIGITGSGANEAAHIKTNAGEALEFHIGQSAASTTPDITFLANGGGIAIQGTTVIDSSRNLNNIGNISSGNITVNGATSGLEGGEIFLTGAGTNEGINIDNYGGTFRVFDGSAPAVRLQLDTNGNATFAGTINSGAITSSGTIDINSDSGQLQFGADNDMQIFHNGAGGEINNTTGNFTIDSSGDIELNADGGDWLFYDGSTTLGSIQNDGNNNLVLMSNTSDKDIKFLGIDNGNTITALTLDMSEGGKATFAGDVTIDDKLTIGDGTANSNSFIEFGERIGATETNRPFLGQTNSGNGVSQDLGLGANSSSGTVKIYAGNVAKFAESAVRLKVANDHINFTEPLQMGGTEFLSDARNLSNIGTISSGAITSTGISLFGKTVADNTTNGIRIDGTNDFVSIVRDGDLPLLLNRKTSDGDIALFRKDSATVGSIGTSATDLFIGTGVAGLRFREAGSQLMPWNTTTNAANDSAIDIGKSDAKFKDLYLSGDVTANSVKLSGLQTQVLGVSSGKLLVGAVNDDDFITKIVGFGGSTSMEFNDGTINAVGSTTINHAKSSATNPVLSVKNTSTTNEGRYLQFLSSIGTNIGQIGHVDQTESNFFISTFSTGLKFESYITYKAILPCGTNGEDSDNAIDLGSSSVRFDDIYATNGTIQTSDRNLKQDIQALTDAEQRVATACKGLIRRFRWQDSVAEKDDNSDSDETARYHFGVIAQDLQDAFTAEGLDASDYGMFISSTWEDDDGVEQTRLGVRYNELLAFIITTI